MRGACGRSHASVARRTHAQPVGPVRGGPHVTPGGGTDQGVWPHSPRVPAPATSPVDYTVDTLTARALTILEAAVRLKTGGKGEPRPGQVQMVEAMCADLHAGRSLSGRGPVGVGKSFAYLSVLIAAAELDDARSIVATETLALQQQLVDDIELVLEAAGSDTAWAFLAGRANHVCHLRLTESRLEPVPQLVARYFGDTGDDQAARDDDVDETDALTPAGQVRAVLKWAGKHAERNGFTPAATKITTPPRGVSKDSPAWRAITISSGECLGSSCAFWETECHPRQAGQLARDANVVITNHAMLMCRPSSLFGDSQRPVRVDAIVADEGHGLAQQVRERATRKWGPHRLAGVPDAFARAVSDDGKGKADNTTHTTAERIARDLMAALAAGVDARRTAMGNGGPSLLAVSGRERIGQFGPSPAARHEARAVTGHVATIIDTARAWLADWQEQHTREVDTIDTQVAALVEPQARDLEEAEQALTTAGPFDRADAERRRDRAELALRAARAAARDIFHARAERLADLRDTLDEHARMLEALAHWAKYGWLAIRPPAVADGDPDELDGELAETGVTYDPADVDGSYPFDPNTVHWADIEIGDCGQCKACKPSKRRKTTTTGTCTSRQPVKVRLYRAPLDVSGALSWLWYEQGPTAIVSASLHELVLREIGLPNDAGRYSWESPFAPDYARTRLYIPPHQPASGRRGGHDETAATTTIAELAAAAGTTKTLVLCASRRRMLDVTAAIAARTSHLPGLVVDQSQPGATARFRDPDSDVRVLVGLRSCATGLSVPGMAQVLLDKLPRSAPNPLDDARSTMFRDWAKTEPLEPEARTVAERSGAAYELDTLIRTEQAAGRLVRVTGDWGLIAVTDSRVRTSSYQLAAGVLDRFCAGGPVDSLDDAIAAVATRTASVRAAAA